MPGAGAVRGRDVPMQPAILADAITEPGDTRRDKSSRPEAEESRHEGVVIQKRRRREKSIPRADDFKTLWHACQRRRRRTVALETIGENLRFAAAATTWRRFSAALRGNVPRPTEMKEEERERCGHLHGVGGVPVHADRLRAVAHRGE